MSEYNLFPAVNATHEFPPAVRQAMVDSAEMSEKFAYDDAGVLKIDGVAVPLPAPSPGASLDVVGWAKAVFIAPGGTVPVGTSPYTLVVETAV